MHRDGAILSLLDLGHNRFVARCMSVGSTFEQARGLRGRAIDDPARWQSPLPYCERSISQRTTAV